jgi:hypothetical protein
MGHAQSGPRATDPFRNVECTPEVRLKRDRVAHQVELEAGLVLPALPAWLLTPIRRAADNHIDRLLVHLR